MMKDLVQTSTSVATPPPVPPKTTTLSGLIPLPEQIQCVQCKQWKSPKDHWWCRSCQKTLCSTCNLMQGHTEHRTAPWRPDELVGSLVDAIEARCAARVNRAAEEEAAIREYMREIEAYFLNKLHHQLEERNEEDRSLVSVVCAASGVTPAERKRWPPASHSPSVTTNSNSSIHPTLVGFDLLTDDSVARLVNDIGRLLPPDGARTLTVSKFPRLASFSPRNSAASSPLLGGDRRSFTMIKTASTPESDPDARSPTNATGRFYSFAAVLPDIEPMEFAQLLEQQRDFTPRTRSRSQSGPTGQARSSTPFLEHVGSRAQSPAPGPNGATLSVYGSVDVEVVNNSMSSTTSEEKCTLATRTTSVKEANSSTVVTQAVTHYPNHHDPSIQRKHSLNGGEQRKLSVNGDVKREFFSTNGDAQRSFSSNGDVQRKVSNGDTQRTFSTNGQEEEAASSVQLMISEDTQTSSTSWLTSATQTETIGNGSLQMTSTPNETPDMTRMFADGVPPVETSIESSKSNGNGEGANGNISITAFHFGDDFLSRPIDVRPMPNGRLAVSDSCGGVFITDAKGQVLHQIAMDGFSASSLCYLTTKRSVDEDRYPPLLLVSVLRKRNRTVNFYDARDLTLMDTVECPNDPAIDLGRSRWLAADDRGALFMVSGDGKISALWKYYPATKGWICLKKARKTRYQYLDVVVTMTDPASVTLLTCDGLTGSILMITVSRHSNGGNSKIIAEEDFSQTYGLGRYIRSPASAVVDYQGNMIILDYTTGKLWLLRAPKPGKSQGGNESDRRLKLLAEVGPQQGIGLSVTGPWDGYRPHGEHWCYLACFNKKRVHAVKYLSDE